MEIKNAFESNFDNSVVLEVFKRKERLFFLLSFLLRIDFSRSDDNKGRLVGKIEAL